MEQRPPLDEIPTTLAELHRVTWSMHGERLEKLQAQSMMLQAQTQAIQSELAKTEAALNAHKTKLRGIYRLADADRVDLETGAITRDATAMATG